MQGLYLAMYGDKVGVGQALFISIFAMAVVFIVLLIISYLIDITAFFLKGSGLCFFDFPLSDFLFQLLTNFFVKKFAYSKYFL